jgi:hypothetical protein
MRIRTYSQLKSYTTFQDRFEYLKLTGIVGAPTFDEQRYLNQQFYRSREWQQVRHIVIARDEGSDLGIPGYEIFDRPIVHHMNPMIADDIVHSNDDILNPEYLILVSHETHNAIHYGDARHLPRTLIERRPGDTKLW